jgi:FAD:protein FMN transferase
MNGIRFKAIGTTAHLLVTQPGALIEADSMLRGFLAELDVSCSRFREDSALSSVNRNGGGTDVHPMLFDAIEVALTAAWQTDGLVVPTLGASMIAIGYDRSFAQLPSSSERAVTPVVPPSWREIVTDEATRSVKLPRGVQLDLGATAKAWAADVAAQRIADRLGCGVLVNLGGDLAIAGEAPDGWRVRVTADHSARTGGQVVTIRSGGLATSSTTVREWRRADEVLHHVLDPATGLPAKRIWRYVSVSAADCVAANTAATAALVLGAKAPRWLAEHDLASRLVAPDGSVTTLAGWPTEVPAVSTMECV